MTDRTPTRTIPARQPSEPVSIGDALAELLPCISPTGVLHSSDVAVHIGWGRREGSLCTVGEMRALIANLPDTMLVTPVVERWRRNGAVYREFAGLRIEAGDEL